MLARVSVTLIRAITDQNEEISSHFTGHQSLNPVFTDLHAIMCGLQRHSVTQHSCLSAQTVGEIQALMTSQSIIVDTLNHDQRLNVDVDSKVE